ncbi:hypothetical protein [Caulobacter segnis]|uniref:hypothetical protein n=1 Tax=Caulobacter segnis TaxID=88688 RepID=UPI00285BC4FF|nr:hypothetical protein [Caulobacter segnis]MDR6626026.1 hypothetical protein [Caulobacter segnis]
MSINAVSSQPSVYAPASQAASAPAFTLEPDVTSAERPQLAPKPPLSVAPLTSGEIQARMALLEQQRPEMEARAKAWHEMLEGWVNAAKDAAAAQNDQPYGQVTKNGEVIATVYNSGVMSGPGATQIDPEHPPGMKGPELAKWRAEQILKAVGGTFAGLDTAETQEGWVSRQANSQPRLGLSEWAAANGYADFFGDRPKVNDIRA